MTDRRNSYTQGLRQLADILDNNPELPLPYHGSGAHLLWIQNYGKDVLATARLFTRLVPGTITKAPRGGDLDLNGNIAGLRVSMITARDAVCERIVTGTHEVDVAAKPAVKATKATTVVVEDVEWVCGSLLSDGVTA
jgi:hypothetical protein